MLPTLAKLRNHAGITLNVKNYIILVYLRSMNNNGYFVEANVITNQYPVLISTFSLLTIDIDWNNFVETENLH